MDGARTAEAHRTTRGRLAGLLLLALALPVVIVLSGTHPGSEQTLEVADAATVQVAAIVSASQSAAPTSRVTSSEAVTSRAQIGPSTSRATTSTTGRASTSASAATSTTAAPSTSASTTTTTAVAKSPARRAAPATTAAPPTTSAPRTTQAPPTTRAPQQDVGAYLSCVRQRESRGNYSAVSANGLYMGAYQFAQGTWDSAARLARRSDLVGRKPHTVVPSDQDAVAIAAYQAWGTQPWGPCH